MREPRAIMGSGRSFDNEGISLPHFELSEVSTGPSDATGRVRAQRSRGPWKAWPRVVLRPDLPLGLPA